MIIIHDFVYCVNAQIISPQTRYLIGKYFYLPRSLQACK
ncbi:unnamed protein product [Rodentolepis nana]|uniref:Uncharacterized protein n=1 Tax=Rodentolepis nana TaxID=102285 RepID=A0A3P7TT27_RODNA|nr:unnamed protein product [Rodentolepis nana]